MTNQTGQNGDTPLDSTKDNENYVLTEDDLVALGKLSPEQLEAEEEESIVQEFETEENVPLDADDDAFQMAKDIGAARSPTDDVDVTRVPYQTPLEAEEVEK